MNLYIYPYIYTLSRAGCHVFELLFWNVSGLPMADTGSGFPSLDYSSVPQGACVD